jgi:hypothetical protein
VKKNQCLKTALEKKIKASELSYQKNILANMDAIFVEN